MEFVELSDLEEGEILEYDSCSPVDSGDDFEIKNRRPFGSVKKGISNCNFELKNSKGRNMCMEQEEKHGYINTNLKEKLQLNGKLGKSNINAIDLESISSEGEYKSDDDRKYVAVHKDRTNNNVEKRAMGKHSNYLYGTVEDIMSKIGETISRKSRCNYKKRKSKDFVKYSDNSYYAWRDKIFSSHLKEKPRKRKVRCSDSDSEFSKSRIEKRKKKKKREVYYEEVGVATKKPNMRDFDEMRRNLLEKLKKQKADELKASVNASPPEVENSEIQEVDMLIDCTNYVDDPIGEAQENSREDVTQSQEKDGEDELDLIKLRLIALASNKRLKNEGGNQSKTDEPPEENVAEDKKPDDSNREQVDLDRNELLLRAEALKTALLKKHQKRLSKLKLEKSKPVETWSGDVNPSKSPRQDEATPKDTETELAANTQKEKVENKGAENNADFAQISNPKTNSMEPLLAGNGNDANPRKANLRSKIKRKKRKSCSLANSLKENSEKSEALEEDDRTLRSQLLSDLMRKKCLKDLEKKSVLTDSIQTSANQIPVVGRCESLKGNAKLPPVATIKKNPLKKVNVLKARTTTKSDLVPKIPKSEIQRIIVHLGSDDSSDENGGPEDGTEMEQNESETKESTPAVESSDPKGKTKELIQASYEKSVELLLSQARSKIEGKMQTPKKNNNNNNNNALTAPEAVYKHLPLSQRLEYLRLKQKIAERERLRKHKSDAFSTNSAPQRRLQAASPAGQEQNDAEPRKPHPNDSIDTSTVSDPKPTAEVRSANGVTAKPTPPRLVAGNRMKNNLMGLHVKGLKKHLAPASVGFKAPQASNSRLLLPSSQALISKLKLLLKKIKIEKMIEENYQKEISKLKSQLNLFERKKTEQRFKIKKLGEESMKTYRAIQGITAKSNERAVVSPKEEKCEEETKTKAEEGPKNDEKSEEGKKVPYEPETEITQSKIDKQVNSGDDDDDDDDDDAGAKVSDTVSAGTSLVLSLLNYTSPLQAFSQVSDSSSSSSARVDPNVTVCQFDLLGVCKDEECTYQHLRTS